MYLSHPLRFLSAAKNKAPFVSALDLPKSSQPYPNVIGSAGRVHVCGIAVLEGDFKFRVLCLDKYRILCTYVTYIHTIRYARDLVRTSRSEASAWHERNRPSDTNLTVINKHQTKPTDSQS